MLCLHRVEALAVGEPEDQRRESEAAERLQHLLGVAPDLGIEAGAPGVEHADDGPVARGEAQRLADARALEAVGDRAARDRSPRFPGGTSGPRRACTCGRSASPAGVTPRITTFDGLPESRFGRLMSTTGSFETSRSPVLADGDVGQALDDAGLPAVDAALHLGLRAARG